MGDLLDITAQVFPAKPLYTYPKIGETPPSAPLARNSPAVDAGYPASAFVNEPYFNGGRINLGAYGNTAQAALSKPPLKGTIVLVR